ncbi:MAG: hypothetical protein JKY95_11715 [Planctomycetaceae bacterium]|nr:hypothetical protein [Planctomycetaceae bacterium]MBL4885187.1 hypothetical protein [Planctomycetaceae bacterium]
MSRHFSSGNRSVSVLSCFIAALFGVAFEAAELEAQSEVYSRFRVLSSEEPGEQLITPMNYHSEVGKSSASNQPVWFAGKIDDMGGGWTQEFEPSENPRALETKSDYSIVPLVENDLLKREQFLAQLSLDANQLAAYQDDSSIVGRALSDVEQQQDEPSAVPENLLEKPCPDCEPVSWIAWKSTTVSGSWLPGTEDRLGRTTFNLSAKIVFPKFQLATITPAYQMYFLNGPQQTDIPSTLYYTSVNLTGYIPFSDRWIGRVSVAPGVASDFQTGSSKQFRIVGVGLMIFKQSEKLQWTFGVAYLDRDDIALLPLAGISWTPNDKTHFDFIFPRPRLKWQLSKSSEHEKWGYIGAEFGGGSWAIDRSDGVEDVVVIREYQMLAGIEYKLPESRSWFWETGIVLGRSVEYSSGLGDYKPPATFVLSGGLTY